MISLSPPTICNSADDADFLKNHDKVRDRISELVGERIGSPPDQGIIDTLEKEGEARYNKKIPPGYEDESGKDDDTFSFNSVIYKKKFGDWFIWKEILNYVESNDTSSVIYVTNDEKEDWWYKIGGRTRGPHESLKTELAVKGNGTMLFLYNSSSFLNSANLFLKGAATSEEAIIELERVSADSHVYNYKALEHYKEGYKASVGAVNYITDFYKSLKKSENKWWELEEYKGNLKNHPVWHFGTGENVNNPLSLMSRNELEYYRHNLINESVAIQTELQKDVIDEDTQKVLIQKLNDIEGKFNLLNIELFHRRKK
ncbi:PIN-like domain-containing protein [Duffyella gerundensis]|uniref:PIN-like domain-containing protein n=1 Tax=Duffyella gerundensis TaxID=1619313 RepID=UPI0021CC6BF3|nr:PIN-like domain-containing protein [Duffyella gerundensis]